MAASPGGDEARRRGRDIHLHIWPLLRDLTEKDEPSEGNAAAAALIPPEEGKRLRTFTATVTRLRERGAEGGLEALIERTVRRPVTTSPPWRARTARRAGRTCAS